MGFKVLKKLIIGGAVALLSIAVLAGCGKQATKKDSTAKSAKTEQVKKVAKVKPATAAETKQYQAKFTADMSVLQQKINTQYHGKVPNLISGVKSIMEYDDGDDDWSPVALTVSNKVFSLAKNDQKAMAIDIIKQINDVYAKDFVKLATGQPKNVNVTMDNGNWQIPFATYYYDGIPGIVTGEDSLEISSKLDDNGTASSEATLYTSVFHKLQPTKTPAKERKLGETFEVQAGLQLTVDSLKKVVDSDDLDSDDKTDTSDTVLALAITLKNTSDKPITNAMDHIKYESSADVDSYSENWGDSNNNYPMAANNLPLPGLLTFGHEDMSDVVKANNLFVPKNDAVVPAGGELKLTLTEPMYGAKTTALVVIKPGDSSNQIVVTNYVPLTGSFEPNALDNYAEYVAD